MGDIYTMYSELISVIMGWAIGFYIMASLLMYIIMAATGMAANYAAAISGKFEPEEYEDVPEIPRGVARSLSLAAFGLTFASLHVAIYALLVTVFTVQYMDSGAGGDIITAGSSFHVYSMIYAWLVAGAFAIATAVAWYTADTAYSLIMSLVNNIARLFGLAGKWLVKRNGWQVDPTAVGTSLFLATFALLWSLALALTQGRPSIISGELPALWIVPGAAVAVVIGYSVKMYRQHRDTLAILDTRLEELD